MTNPKIEAKKAKLRAHIQKNIPNLNNADDLAVLEAMPPTIKGIKALIAVAGGQYRICGYVTEVAVYTIYADPISYWTNEITYIPGDPIWGDTWCIHAVLLMRLLKVTGR